MKRAELVEVIGLEAAVLLTRSAGGKRMYMSPPTADDPVVKVIGMDAYRRLHKAFGGEMLDLPSFSSVRALARREQALHLLHKGMSVRKVAAETKLSRRGVARLLGEIHPGRAR